MKNIILIPTILILIITSVVAQDYPKARYLNIQNDKNIRPDSDKKLCVSCSDNNFIIDGDESHGYIELNFSGIDLYGQAKMAKAMNDQKNVERNYWRIFRELEEAKKTIDKLETDNG